MTVAEFLKDYGPVVAWVFIAAGWIITNIQANTREKRKELRGEIDSLEESLLEFAENMDEYLRRPEGDIGAGAKELAALVLYQSIDRRIERLSKRQKPGVLGLYLDAIQAAREDLYDFATGGYFQTSARLGEPDLSERIQGIYARAHILIESLHTFFLAKFDNYSSDEVVGAKKHVDND